MKGAKRLMTNADNSDFGTSGGESVMNQVLGMAKSRSGMAAQRQTSRVLLALLLVGLLAIILLPACSSGFRVEGNWRYEGTETFINSVRPGDIVTFQDGKTGLRSSGFMIDSYILSKAQDGAYLLEVTQPGTGTAAYQLKPDGSDTFVLETQNGVFKFSRIG
jgi:hypothetical protein